MNHDYIPTIRQLSGLDSNSYYRLRLMGLELHPEAFGTGAEDFKKATDDQVKALLDKSSKDDFVLGAFHDAELVGVIGFKREYKHSVSHKGTIWGLFVTPKQQRRGIAKGLLKRLVGTVSENVEIDYIRAIVTVDSGAVSVFKSLGFSQYGLELRGIRTGTNYFDQSYVRLNLRSFT
jgi:ribosomal protein S18 acetylase RimI-like enzyme